MLDVEKIYEKDSDGNKTDSIINSTMDIVAGQIVRNYNLACPNDHFSYPTATVVLGIINDKVVVLDITNYCCEAFRASLFIHLRQEMDF